MGCALRVVGSEFDVDSFLKDSELEATAVFRRGAVAAQAAAHNASGFSVTVCDAGLNDLDAELDAATRFLGEHEEELRRLSAFPGVEEVCLDLAVRRQDVPAQSELFPAELLWRAGALDIDLMVTHYALADAES